MKIGLYIIGDEILSGLREDKHLRKVAELLPQYGHTLAWAKVLGDDMDLLVENFQHSLSRQEVVLSTGGIGGTPDDLTRHAVAKALNVDLQAHPEGLQILEKKYGEELTDLRRRMIEFPKGATLIPNPVNQVPGFSVAQHHFVPGFTEMAWPMMEWVLKQNYSGEGQLQAEKVVCVLETYESALIPLMEKLMQEHKEVKVFSLPRISGERSVDLGVRGPKEMVDRAFVELEQGLELMQVKWEQL